MATINAIQVLAFTRKLGQRLYVLCAKRRPSFICEGYILFYKNVEQSMENSMDQSMTFHKFLPGQYQTLRLPTLMGVDNKRLQFHYSASQFQSKGVSGCFNYHFVLLKILSWM